jgi:putative membrane protein
MVTVSTIVGGRQIMYMYGPWSWWMMLMPLLWLALIAVAVWVVVRIIRSTDAGSSARPPEETPLEILDRRYARGEIDDHAYATARARLTGRDA